MGKLIFDIETVGQRFESLDKISQKHIEEQARIYKNTDETFEERFERRKNQLSLSPLTSEIVSIAILNNENDSGAVYSQSPEKKIEEFKHGMVKFIFGNEKEILENFWRVINGADKIITFNGRGFDCPFIIIRSAIHQIKQTRNLMPNRYSTDFHIDLLDQLSFYGALQKRGNLHSWCQAFNIKSPKSIGIDGQDVKKLFQDKKYNDIAKYCLEDVIATKELFNIWEKYIKA